MLRVSKTLDLFKKKKKNLEWIKNNIILDTRIYLTIFLQIFSTAPRLSGHFVCRFICKENILLGRKEIGVSMSRDSFGYLRGGLDRSVFRTTSSNGRGRKEFFSPRAFIRRFAGPFIFPFISQFERATPPYKTTYRSNGIARFSYSTFNSNLYDRFLLQIRARFFT